jgi:hypothetical protein
LIIAVSLLSENGGTATVELLKACRPSRSLSRLLDLGLSDESRGEVF